jgi:hypothetical protein
MPVKMTMIFGISDPDVETDLVLKNIDGVSGTKYD